MSRIKFFSVLAMAIGAFLTGKGLFGSLVNVKLIGAIRYTEMNLGGRELAIAIIVLLGLSTLLVGMGDRTSRVAWLFGGTGLGLTIASLLAIYRGTMDKLMELGGDDVNKLLVTLEVQTGTYLIAGGLLLFIGGMIGTLFERKQERW